MNRNMIAVTGVAMLLSLIAVGEAQHEHEHPAITNEAPADSRQEGRVLLCLSQEAEAGLKLAMREHLEALPDVITALGGKEFD